MELLEFLLDFLEMIVYKWIVLLVIRIFFITETEMNLEQHCQIFVSLIVTFIIILKVARVYKVNLMWSITTVTYV